MIQQIPAPGFRAISGKRNPPDGDGVKYWVQCRNGWVDELGPWPVRGPRWTHSGSAWDIVAVRRDGVRSPQTKDGRQANGSYE